MRRFSTLPRIILYAAASLGLLATATPRASADAAGEAAIQAHLPAGKTILTAAQKDLIAAVNAAVLANSGSAAGITASALDIIGGKQRADKLTLAPILATNAIADIGGQTANDAVSADIALQLIVALPGTGVITDIVRGNVAAAAINANESAAAAVGTAVGTNGHVISQLAFATAALKAFSKTSLTETNDASAFTTALFAVPTPLIPASDGPKLAKAVVANPKAAGGVVGAYVGQAAEASRLVLTASAIKALPTAVAPISQSVAETLTSGSQAAFAGGLANSQTVAVKGAIASGVVAAVAASGTASVAAVVTGVINATSATVAQQITLTNLATFAAAASGSVLNNPAAIGVVAQTSLVVKGVTDALTQGKIGAAVAKVAPLGAGAVAADILALGNITSSADKTTFATTVVASVLTNTVAAQGVAAAVGATLSLEPDKVSLAKALITKDVKAAQLFSTALAQQVPSDFTTQGNFARDLANASPTAGVAIAAGVADNSFDSTDYNAALIAARVAEANTKTQAVADKIAGAVTGVLGVNSGQADQVAYAMGVLLSGSASGGATLKITQAGPIAAAIVKAYTGPKTTTGGQEELGGIASSLIAQLPIGATTATKTAARTAAAAVAAAVAKTVGLDLASIEFVAGSAGAAAAAIFSGSDLTAALTAIETSVAGAVKSVADKTAVKNAVAQGATTPGNFQLGPVGGPETPVQNI